MTFLGCGDSEIDVPASNTAPVAIKAAQATGQRQSTDTARNQQTDNSRNPGVNTTGSLTTSSPVVFQGKQSKTRPAVGDWRRFRGPDGAGVSDVTGLPTKWSATENIAWERQLPGPGASSPIVVGDRIYVTCYSGHGPAGTNPGGKKENLRRHLVCLDRKTGRIVWNSPVTHERSGIYDHDYASSTPVSDGKRIYAYFGNWGAYAFDRDGKQLWRFDCGEKTREWGSAASPILHGNLLIINAAVEGEALIAIDKTTGKEEWRSERITMSWSTPVIVNAEGRDEVVLPNGQGIRGFDVKSGLSLWKWATSGTSGYTTSSLIHHKGILYGLNANRGVAAIRPGGNGEANESHTVWKSPRFHSTVASPVFHEDYLYIPHYQGGYIVCIDAKTGEEKIRVRGKPGFGWVYASPLVADGKLYVVTRANGTYVFKAGPDMEQIAHNQLADFRSIFDASPVPHNGQLLIRSSKSLYCIGKYK